MATKPARVFTWCTSVALGADPTQRLDIPASWKTNGVADTDRFLHEYANDTFGLISEWIEFVDERTLDQVATNHTATLTTFSDAGEEVFLFSTGGGAPTRVVANYVVGGTGVSLGGITSGAQLTDPVGVDGTIPAAATVPTVQVINLSPVGNRILDEASIATANVALSRTWKDASAAERTAHEPGRSLYVDNLVQCEAIVAINTSTGTIAYDTTAGTEGYNVEPGSTPTLVGNKFRVALADAAGILGRVHVHASPTPGSADVGLIRVLASYVGGPAPGYIEVEVQATSNTDFVTNSSLISGGVVNVAAPAGVYRIYVTMY